MTGKDHLAELSNLADELVARGAWEVFDFAVEGRRVPSIARTNVEIGRAVVGSGWVLWRCDPVARRVRMADDPAELVDDFVGLVGDLVRLRGRVLAPAGAPSPPILSQGEADAVLIDLAAELEAAGMPEGLVFCVHGLGGGARARRAGRGEVMHVGFEDGQFRVWFDEKGSEHTFVVSPRPEVACQVLRRESTKMVGDMAGAHPQRLGPLADVTGWPEQTR